MYVNKRKSKEYGFTLTESLMVVLISSILLVSFYQIIFGSIHFFTDKKNKSDTLETKTPSVELISRYFERWGVGVVTDPLSATEALEIANLPKTDKFIKVNTVSSAGATETDPIVFYANLSGIGFVKSLGTKANLVSCRLDDKVGKNSNGDSCYYVLRNNNILPNNLNSDADLTSPYSYKLIDSVSFNTDNTSDPNRYIKGGLECVSDRFADPSSGSANSTTSGMIDTNSTIGLTGTIVDSDSASISSTIITGVLPSSTFTLQAGDIIFRAPHRIKMYVKDNSEDKNRKWLYVSATPVASKCRTSTTADEIAEPIAPANLVTATIVDRTGAPALPAGDIDRTAVEVTVNFRSEPYKGQPAKVLIVKRIFGV